MRGSHMPISSSARRPSEGAAAMDFSALSVECYELTWRCPDLAISEQRQRSGIPVIWPAGGHVGREAGEVFRMRIRGCSRPGRKQAEEEFQAQKNRRGGRFSCAASPVRDLQVLLDGAPRGQRPYCGSNVPQAAITCDARLCWGLAMSG